MKVCPDCSTTYPDEFVFCPLDAKALLQFQTAIRETAETRERAAGALVGGELPSASAPTLLSEPPAGLAAPASPTTRGNDATIVGRYELGRRLGKGHLGEVYEAVDLEDQGRWALKIVDREHLLDHLPPGRFVRQAEPLTALCHPGLAAVREVGETADGEPFLVQELVRGTEPFELTHPVPLDTLCWLGMEVAEALAAVHAFGTIHGDLKPRHIVLTPEGSWKLLDVGLMPMLESLTPEDALAGTPGYIAPERVRRETWADPRSDLFSLGAVLYELLAGRLPAPERPGIPVLRAGPRIPESLQRLVLSLLEPDPAERPASALEVAGILAAIRQEISAQPAVVLPAPERPYARRPVSWPESGLFNRRLEIAGKTVTGVAFSPDGQALAGASKDGGVRLWGPQNDQTAAGAHRT